MKRLLIAGLAIILPSIPVVSFAETAYYQYDALGRLTKSFKQGGGADGTLTTISNDAADNRTNYAVLNVVKTLMPGDKVYSADNRFYVTVKANGNLAVVVASGGSELWASGGSTIATHHASFQSNGNLVLYDASANSLWSSNTANNPASQLFMQNDGNLVIKDVNGTQLWQTNTGGH